MKVLAKDGVVGNRVELHFDTPVDSSAIDGIERIKGISYAFQEDRYSITLVIGLLFSKEDVITDVVALLGAELVNNKKQ